VSNCSQFYALNCFNQAITLRTCCERNGDISTVTLLVEQTEAHKNENEHKQKDNHHHPQFAEGQRSRAWRLQIIVEPGNW